METHWAISRIYFLHKKLTFMTISRRFLQSFRRKDVKKYYPWKNMNFEEQIESNFMKNILVSKSEFYMAGVFRFSLLVWWLLTKNTTTLFKLIWTWFEKKTVQSTYMYLGTQNKSICFRKVVKFLQIFHCGI